MSSHGRARRSLALAVHEWGASTVGTPRVGGHLPCTGRRLPSQRGRTPSACGCTGRVGWEGGAHGNAGSRNGSLDRSGSRSDHASIQRHDRALAVQLRNAASSMVLNIAESEYSDPGNRRARLFTAAGSTNESRSAVRVAIAWGYIREERAADVLARFDAVMAILWRLTHGP